LVGYLEVQFYLHQFLLCLNELSLRIIVNKITVDIFTELLYISEHINRPWKLFLFDISFKHSLRLSLIYFTLSQNINYYILDLFDFLCIWTLLFLDYFWYLSKKMLAYFSSFEEYSLLLQIEVDEFHSRSVIDFGYVILETSHYKFYFLLSFHSSGCSTTFTVFTLCY
jgi:hypothetical protein